MADDVNIEDVRQMLKDASPAMMKAAGRGAMRAGLVIHNQARRNAPRSPSEAQKRAERIENKGKPRPKPIRRRSALSRFVRKTKGVLGRILHRRPRARARAVPGGLEKSIELERTEAGVTIFVAANSPAGKYAKRIHDEKGKTWWNRGRGTRDKGAQADDKFIERAVDANRDKIAQYIDDEIRKVIA